MFVVLNAIQLCINCVHSNQKVGVIGMKFSIQFFRYKFHKVCTKSLFCFWKKIRIRKTLSTCQKKTTIIYLLIFNKLDIQDCFFNFKDINEYIKAYLNRSFETVVLFLASCLLFFWKLSVLFSFLFWSFLQRFIQTGWKSCIWELSGFFFLRKQKVNLL